MWESGADPISFHMYILNSLKACDTEMIDLYIQTFNTMKTADMFPQLTHFLHNSE